jgi:hypothetical protein
MTGTGTQNDPYIISDWNDFITAVGTSNAYVEFPKNLVHTSDTNVDPNKLYTDANGVVQTNVQVSDLPDLYENDFYLDANDYAPEGLSSTITISCASINGFGGGIVNLASSAADIFYCYITSGITGIAFLNVNCADRNFLYAGTSGWKEISKCIFSGRMDGSDSCYFFLGNYVRLKSCAVNVQLYNSSEFVNTSASVQLITCRVNTEDHRGVSTSSNQFRVENCYWTGNYNHYLNSIGTDTYNYSVFDLECAYIHSNNDTLASYTFVNSDKCDDIRGVSVTTEELQSASALAAKGFPIQV